MRKVGEGFPRPFFDTAAAFGRVFSGNWIGQNNNYIFFIFRTPFDTTCLFTASSFESRMKAQESQAGGWSILTRPKLENHRGDDPRILTMVRSLFSLLHRDHPYCEPLLFLDDSEFPFESWHAYVWECIAHQCNSALLRHIVRLYLILMSLKFLPQ